MRKAYSLIQKSIELRLKFSKPLGYALMFHQVNDDVSEWNYEDMSIRMDSFKKLIDKLMDDEFKFIAIDDIFNDNSKDKFVVLTFDDGYADIFNHVYPYLKSRDIPFTVFIAIDLIGRDKYMSIDELEVLAYERLCTIGSHTISHKFLRSLSEDDCKTEIENSKKLLEEKLKIGINYFAYPYGSVLACSKREINVVQECKYKAAFSTINATINGLSLKNTFFLPRKNVNEQNYYKVIK